MGNSIRSYFLLFLFLFGALVPGQTQEELTKLPVLWHHYQLHKSQHPETGLLEYLQLHYSKGFAKHRSAHDHSKLPMKSGDNHLHASAAIDPPKVAEVRIAALTTGSQPVAFEGQIFPQSPLNDIWQPPKSC